MPTFYQEAEIDISIEEFVDQLSDWELEELKDRINDALDVNVTKNIGDRIANDETNIALDKLARNLSLLTVEEEDYIKKLAERFL